MKEVKEKQRMKAPKTHDPTRRIPQTPGMKNATMKQYIKGTLRRRAPATRNRMPTTNTNAHNTIEIINTYITILRLQHTICEKLR